MAAPDTGAAEQAVVAEEQVMDQPQAAQVNKVTQEVLHQAAAELPAQQAVDQNLKKVEIEAKAQDKVAQVPKDIKVTLPEPTTIMVVAAVAHNPVQEMVKAKTLEAAAMEEHTLAAAVHQELQAW